MLEVFKDLTIRGDAAALDRLVPAIAGLLPEGWSRDSEAEERLRDPIAGIQYVFRFVGREELPAVSLFMVRDAESLEVSNIVPQETGSISRAQYNLVVDEFAGFAGPVARNMGLTVLLTADQEPITHWLSTAAADELRRFAVTANKSTGSAHPMDFARWASFLIAAHRERASLDSSTLARWLEEVDHWPEDTAHDLALEYEFARQLLKSYDGA